MDKLCIHVGERLAGYLTREGQSYDFEYLADYDGPAVFLGWDLEQRRRKWEEFPPAFDGLLPEGVLLEQLLAKHKLDKSDKWGQLSAVGLDLTGFVSVVPEGRGISPVGKLIFGEIPRKRTIIEPAEEALPYTALELVAYHSKHKLRMSLSGVQPKVSAIFSRKEKCFKVVESNGSYILKPSPQAFPGAAENEALTMRLAKNAGVDVPLCGWLQTRDGSGVFWIERFDRWGVGNRNRVRCEDVCQILEIPASWKYSGNFETLVRVIRNYCSNPRLQLSRLFHRILFCWVTGNGDMHLKNWSLVENGPLIELSPAYDLINTKLLIGEDEESALSLNNQKTDFDRPLLIDYLGREICDLNNRMISKILNQLRSVDWNECISESNLPAESCARYQTIVHKRLQLLVK